MSNQREAPFEAGVKEFLIRPVVLGMIRLLRLSSLPGWFSPSSALPLGQLCRAMMLLWGPELFFRTAGPFPGIEGPHPPCAAPPARPRQFSSSHNDSLFPSAPLWEGDAEPRRIRQLLAFALNPRVQQPNPSQGAFLSEIFFQGPRFAIRWSKPSCG